MYSDKYEYFTNEYKHCTKYMQVQEHLCTSAQLEHPDGLATLVDLPLYQILHIFCNFVNVNID